MRTALHLTLISALASCLVGCSRPAATPTEASLLDIVAPAATPVPETTNPSAVEQEPAPTPTPQDTSRAPADSPEPTGPLTLLPGHKLANRKLVPTVAQTNRGQFGVAVTPGAAPRHCRAVVQAMLDGAFVDRPLRLHPGFVELTGRGHFLAGCREANRVAPTPGTVFARGPATLMIVTGPIEPAQLQGAVCIGFLAFGRELLEQLPTQSLTVHELKPLAI